MLSRAIAPVVGTSHVTVKNDLDSSVKDFTDEHSAPRAVHGRDGITRTFQPRTAPEPVTVDHETGVDGGVRVPVNGPHPRRRHAFGRLALGVTLFAPVLARGGLQARTLRVCFGARVG